MVSRLETRQVSCAHRESSFTATSSLSAAADAVHQLDGLLSCWMPSTVTPKEPVGRAGWRAYGGSRRRS